VLEAAVEYGRLERSPARGKRRRLPNAKPPRTWIDRADHIASLLDGATAVHGDALVPPRPAARAAGDASVAGLRIGEALALAWRDVDLARGTLRVRDSKTSAGVRDVHVLPALRDELLAYGASLGDVDRSVLVFGTGAGRRQSETTCAGASSRRRSSTRTPHSGTTASSRCRRALPHSLRRTFASILVALGEDPVYASGQLGHTAPTTTLGIYAREMARRDGERDRLRVLVEGADAGYSSGSSSSPSVAEKSA
jgi:integrase